MRVAYLPADVANYRGIESENALDRRRLAALEPLWRASGLQVFPWKPNVQCDIVYLVSAQKSLQALQHMVRKDHDRHAIVAGIIEDVGTGAWAGLAAEAPDDPVEMTVAWSERALSIRGRLRRLRNRLAKCGLFETTQEQLLGLLARVDGVLCTSELQAAALRQTNPFCTGIADYVPNSDYAIRDVGVAEQLLRTKQERGAVLMAWEGTAWGLQLLELIREPLNHLAEVQAIKIALVIIAPRNRPTPLFGSTDNEAILRERYVMPTFRFDWSLSTVGAILRACDIGLAPMPQRNPFYRAKAYSKPLVYMINELPVVASAIPSYQELIRDGVDGFVAGNNNEWASKLQRLCEHEALRRALGSAGRTRAGLYHPASRAADTMTAAFLEAHEVWCARKRNRATAFGS